MSELVHLACIMDGNGRWAQAKGLKRTDGHKQGAYAAEKVAKGCIKNGIKFLTLYCFSTENWRRPKEEVDYLMGLLSLQVQANIPKFNKLGIRILFLGNKDGIPESSYNGILKAVEATRNNSILTVQLAINYGGWDEISRAANRALESGITHFSPETLLSFLDNPSVPSPDMIVRSAGECRLSGFMLLQSNYAEFGFYEKLWPDWDESMVELILEDFNNRTRKYGGIKN